MNLIYWGLFYGRLLHSLMEFLAFVCSLVELVCYVILFRRIINVTFTFLTFASWFPTSSSGAAGISISQVVSFRIYYQSIRLVNQNHGLVILAFYFPYVIELKKILHQSWLMNVVYLILGKLEQPKLMIMVAAPWKYHLFWLVDIALVRWVPRIALSRVLITKSWSTVAQWTLKYSSYWILTNHCGSCTIS